MTLDLYYVPGSPPCRTVLLAAKALNLNLNLKLVDLQHGEHLKPEYLKVWYTTSGLNNNFWDYWRRV